MDLSKTECRTRRWPLRVISDGPCGEGAHERHELSTFQTLKRHAETFLPTTSLSHKISGSTVAQTPMSNRHPEARASVASEPRRMTG